MRLPHLLIIFILFSFLASSCNRKTYPLGRVARKAYKARLKSERLGYDRFDPVKLPLDSLGVGQWRTPSPNFDIRTPDLVIIHHTAENSCKQALRTLTDPRGNRKVSAHYLICKDGTVYQLVNERYRAWQAGISRWGNIHNVNSVSLGIELDNNGDEPFPDKQIASLLILLHSIKQRYYIPTANFVGHADIAPTRKQDPSVYFPWAELAANGFGYWRDSILPDPPPDFDYKTALRLIGYDIRDTAAAVIAFKRHFVQTDISASLSEEDRKVLYDIFLKYDQ